MIDKIKKSLSILNFVYLIPNFNAFKGGEIVSVQYSEAVGNFNKVNTHFFLTLVPFSHITSNMHSK